MTTWHHPHATSPSNALDLQAASLLTLLPPRARQPQHLRLIDSKAVLCERYALVTLQHSLPCNLTSVLSVRKRLQKSQINGGRLLAIASNLSERLHTFQATEDCCCVYTARPAPPPPACPADGAPPRSDSPWRAPAAASPPRPPRSDETRRTSSCASTAARPAPGPLAPHPHPPLHCRCCPERRRSHGCGRPASRPSRSDPQRGSSAPRTCCHSLPARGPQSPTPGAAPPAAGQRCAVNTSNLSEKKRPENHKQRQIACELTRN